MNNKLYCIALSLSIASPVYAEVFSWFDDAGTVHFTDQYSSIPPRYINKVNIRDDISQAPPPFNPPAKLKRKMKSSSQTKPDQRSNGAASEHPRMPNVQESNHHQYPNEGNVEFKKFRRRGHEDTKRSQTEIYNSQTDARKATNEAQRQIDKAKNVGQQQINDAHQAQQRAQDMINNSRNTGIKR